MMAMTQESLLGQALSTPQAEARSFFDQAVMALANNRGGVARLVKKSIEADSGFVMGHCLMGYVLMLGSSSAYMPLVRGRLDKASTGVEGITPWERSHVEALRVWSEGRADCAAEAWEGILREHPTDLLALDLAHLNYFWLGDSENLRDVVARVRPSWEESTPGYSFMLGMHGFGMEECGQYDQAEATAREAVEREPTDIWATHAVAHVMEMQGRHRDGIAYLDGLKEHWDGSSTFALHLWWHRALYHLELEQFDQVFELYDSEVRRGESEFYLDFQNASSLLWRLELAGADVGGRWEELADKAALHVDDHAMVFTEFHYLMALGSAGRNEDARKFLDSLRAHVEAHPDHGAATVLREVTLPVCEAVLAFKAGEDSRAADLLTPVMDGLHRTGGSHAQRDVIGQTLIAAALRGGRNDQALSLLQARTIAKPASAWSWTRYGEALQAHGDSAAAEDARLRAAELLEG